MTTAQPSETIGTIHTNPVDACCVEGDPPTDSEWHIISLVAYCKAQTINNVSALDAFKQSVEAMPFVELHADDGHAKLVLTIEGSSTAEISDRMEQLQYNENLLSLQMVFHQQDTPTSDALSSTPPQAFTHNKETL